ncbi:sugar ABC transporter ATP-binding protein [Paraburkholderia phymatum]|uniref:sugar ABC transporter ATP-binding protein n=1 Tax=Paraburkholderia phymatum TaxID=148447 RepID=UPI00317F04C7
MSRSDTSHPAIECVAVSKSFGSIQALKPLNFLVEPATIHALVGQNGAGKSTMLGILAGRTAASSGKIFVDGEAVVLGSPRKAKAVGIAAIYQELTIVPQLSAVANVFLGQTLSYQGVLSERAMRVRFRQWCERFGVQIQPDILASSLSVATQQMIEIMRALEADARIVLFDEPTASLAPHERAALFGMMRELKAAGKTLILVSHNLEEVLDIADDITVFRNGEMIRSDTRSAWSKSSLVDAMLGEPVEDVYQARLRRDVPQRSHDILTAEDVSVPGAISDVSVSIRHGEVLGIGGLVGSGRSTLLRALAGLETGSTGRLWINGKAVPWPRSPREARTLGLALVPEDRKGQGLVLGMTSMENIALAGMARSAKWGVISENRMRELSSQASTPLRLDVKRIREPVVNLSGGNQQKALFARWRYYPPTVLLIDEPTRGVDVGAKSEILNAIRAFAEEGVGVALVSSEFEEIVSLADRVVILAEGRQVDLLDTTQRRISVEAILHAAFAIGEKHANY